MAYSTVFSLKHYHWNNTIILGTGFKNTCLHLILSPLYAYSGPRFLKQENHRYYAITPSQAANESLICRLIVIEQKILKSPIKCVTFGIGLASIFLIPWNTVFKVMKIQPILNLIVSPIKQIPFSKSFFGPRLTSLFAQTTVIGFAAYSKWKSWTKYYIKNLQNFCRTAKHQENTQGDFKQLPREIVSHIFSFLDPVSELPKACTLSKWFLDVSHNIRKQKLREHLPKDLYNLFKECHILAYLENSPPLKLPLQEVRSPTNEPLFQEHQDFYLPNNDCKWSLDEPSLDTCIYNLPKRYPLMKTHTSKPAPFISDIDLKSQSIGWTITPSNTLAIIFTFDATFYDCHGQLKKIENCISVLQQSSPFDTKEWFWVHHTLRYFSSYPPSYFHIEKRKPNFFQYSRFLIYDKDDNLRKDCLPNFTWFSSFIKGEISGCINEGKLYPINHDLKNGCNVSLKFKRSFYDSIDPINDE